MLIEAAVEAFLATAVESKIRLTQTLFQRCATERQIPADSIVHRTPPPVEAAGRPQRPELVAPRQLLKRSLFSEEGRRIFVHAIAHIEFNAINLALDAIIRFPGLPPEYYRDWLKVAADEARHFLLLQERLQSLNRGYGDYPAHAGLWSIACQSTSDPLLRMGLVPRVLEARGLDVTPAMIKKLRQVGDCDSAGILEVILADEIDHVATGSKWFDFLCDQRGLDRTRYFATLIEEHFKGELRGPFNHEARKEAGFTNAELAIIERDPKTKD